MIMNGGTENEFFQGRMDVRKTRFPSILNQFSSRLRRVFRLKGVCTKHFVTLLGKGFYLKLSAHSALNKLATREVKKGRKL